MRLAELSERSGVSVGTIKYYLREGLLRPGRRISKTQAEYDESHLRRLNLVRALIQIGHVPVATVREVLGHIDDDSLGTTMRFGAAMWALPNPPEAPAQDPVTVQVTEGVDRLLEMVGWGHAREIGTLSPTFRRLVTALTTFNRLGYEYEPEALVAYAQQMDELAELDLDRIDEMEGDAAKAELVVAAAVFLEPVLLALRRLAQEEHATRRYGL
ncbi:MerR family transcriptional regulator [Streptomyces sp. VRA16 Mangrove soil]|uniref:MerR family transcriptional regulator n=1 Tax=Streptomyces sp. VRA16 Mangrove soil TaxID=2817434 RepID=UPI001A9D2CA9|nr:MerR family transcriptional regulator [Streptomyces sp. VRA16 Mangrove soil]MBO1330630.1 MerR family transcriptional regulator [Streptomyces sp. VRA16 Mangrove soil]